MAQQEQLRSTAGLTEQGQPPAGATNGASADHVEISVHKTSFVSATSNAPSRTASVDDPTFLASLECAGYPAAATAAAAGTAPAAAAGGQPGSPSKLIKSHSMMKHNLSMVAPGVGWKVLLVVLLATAALGIALGVGLGVGLGGPQSPRRRVLQEVVVAANVTVPVTVAGTWQVPAGNNCSSYFGNAQGMTDYVAAINSTYSSALYKLQPVVDVKSVSCDGDSYPTTPAAGRRRLQQGGNSTVNILAVTTTIDLTVQRSVNATLNKTEGQDDAVFDEAIAEMKQGLLKNLSDAADALSRQASDYSDTAMAAAVRNSYGSRILGVPIHNSQVQPPKAKLQTDTRPANNASSAGGGKEELEAGTQDVTDLKLENGGFVEEPKPSPAPRPSPKPGAGDDGAPTSSPDVSSATPGTPRPQPSPTPGSADGGQAGKEDPQAAAALLAQQTEDWKALVKGYTSIPVKNIASSQVLYPPAFAVGTTKDGAALLSAVRYGQGRVVVAGHEGMLGSCCSFEDMGGFTMNAIAWAAGNTSSPKIAANDAMFGDAIRALSANKFVNTFVGEVTPAALNRSQVDVYVVNAQRDDVGTYADNIRAFVAAGGGLVLGGQAWYWSYNQPVETFPGNQVLQPLGIFITANGITEECAVGEALPLQVADVTKALECINATLTQGSSASCYLDEGLLKETMSRVADGATAFADREGLIQKLQKAADQAPSSETGINPDQKINRNSIDGFGALARSTLYQVLDPEDLPAAPDAKWFPGLPPAGTKPLGEVTVQVPSSADASGWKCLGMYALPGEPVTVTVPQALADSNGAKLLVGGWSDTLYHLEQWARVPKAQRRFAVTDVDTVIGSALGGLIYIILPDDWPAVAVTVTGAIRAPMYVEGVTKDADWASILSNSPAPWGEIATSKLVIASPRYSLQRVAKPSETASYWDKVQDSNNWLLGLGPEQRSGPMRMQHDVQISAGYMHSGYPIMTFMDVVNTTVDLSIKDSRWGHLHELGHNHQRGEWTWDCTGEVSVNWFTIRAQMEVNNNTNPANFYGWNGEDTTSRANKRKAYLAAPDYQKLCDDPGLYLDSFMMLVEDTKKGMQLMRDTITSYANIPNDQTPSTDDEKIQTWVIQQSKAAGMNLAAYYKAWGWPVSAATEDTLAGLSLPVWDLESKAVKGTSTKP